MSTARHQQSFAGGEAAMAHWLSPPQTGQRRSKSCLLSISVMAGAIITDWKRGVSMSDEPDDLFLTEMSDVVPLKREPRVPRGGGARDERDTSLEQRRRAAVEGKQADRNFLTEEGIAALDPWLVLDFKRPGVQNGVIRKLKQGRYEAEARLDLHRMTAAVARRELFGFIEQAFELGLRSVLIIHGKGESKAERERSSILKGCTDHWLRQLDIVQAFHSAQPRHGGTGAVYVLLKKSEEKKRENREKFMKGRVPYDPQ